MINSRVMKDTSYRISSRSGQELDVINSRVRSAVAVKDQALAARDQQAYPPTTHAPPRPAPPRPAPLLPSPSFPYECPASVRAPAPPLPRRLCISRVCRVVAAGVRGGGGGGMP